MYKKKPCLNCGKETTNQKYCSHKCQMEYQQKVWEAKWISGEISGFSKNDTYGGILDRIKTYL